MAYAQYCALCHFRRSILRVRPAEGFGLAACRATERRMAPLLHFGRALSSVYVYGVPPGLSIYLHRIYFWIFPASSATS